MNLLRPRLRPFSRIFKRDINLNSAIQRITHRLETTRQQRRNRGRFFETRTTAEQFENCEQRIKSPEISMRSQLLECKRENKSKRGKKY